MLISIIKYLISLGLILIALAIGMAVQHYLALSIPGSIIGMLVLFIAMVSGLIPAEMVRPTANLFIRYMILMFIPISVGLIDHYELLVNNAFSILASTIGGSAIVLIILALMLEKILVRKK